tara:strand:+ start:499 stop:858 length:360 start_codon:yes stop_codon:yes gene_type:complete
MSLINICYRAALKSARYHGWRYSGGIDLQHPGKPQTYLWEHNTYKDSGLSGLAIEKRFVSTEGIVPDEVKRKDIHTALFTLKSYLINNQYDEDRIDKLFEAVREINKIDDWNSYLDSDF